MGSEFLCGSTMTVADILVAVSLIQPLQTVLDAGFRKAMGKLTSWAEKIFSSPECVKVLGKIQMCAKPIKPSCVADVVVKKEEKAAPAAKKEVAKKEDAKPKDNIAALPPSPWVVYDFKTFYVNHKD